MAQRPLTAEEAALWARVMVSVRPIGATDLNRKSDRKGAAPLAALAAQTGANMSNTRGERRRPDPLASPAGPRPSPGKREVQGDLLTLFRAALSQSERPIGGVSKSSVQPTDADIPQVLPAVARVVGKPSNTLDGTWDRQLSRGLVSPDRSIDLHGHTLATAYAVLDTALSRAIADGDRLLLLVTGKPPRADSERPHKRGAIRAAVGDWLAGSRHAAAIAAVRGAHPRHGGGGALYIILRKPRAASKS